MEITRTLRRQFGNQSSGRRGHSPFKFFNAQEGIKLPQYLRNFGLDHLTEENSCLMLIRHVCQEGKVFRGYRCNYLYKNLGVAEMIVTTIDEDNNDDSDLPGAA